MQKAELGSAFVKKDEIFLSKTTEFFGGFVIYNCKE